MSTTVVHVNDPDGFDVYIGRANARRRLAASPFANPFREGRDGSRDEVIEKYRQWILTQPDLLARLSELEGQRLGCWCAPAPCHGHVLVDLIESRTS